MNLIKWRKYLSIRLSFLVLFSILTPMLLTYYFTFLNSVIIHCLVLVICTILGILLLGSIVKKLSALFEDIQNQATFNERKRISREFHDGILQDINYLELKLKILERNLKTKALDDLTLDEIKQLKDNLIELNAKAREELFILRHFSSQDLNEFLAEYLLRFSKKHNIKYQLNTSTSSIRLKPVVMNNLIRIIQEVLTNSYKHGQAENIKLTVEVQNRFLQVVIRDDGKGFDPCSLKSNDCHGLAIIKERIQEINGKLEIDSKEGEGTSIKLVVPLV